MTSQFPLDWKQSTLASVIDLISGQHIQVNDCNTDGRGVPYLTGPADFKNGAIRSSKFTEAPQVCCKVGDILITVKGSGTGTTAIADADYCISRQLMAVRARNSDSTFIRFVLESYAETYNNISAGLIPGIARDDVLNTRLGIPPLAEQQEIGRLLAMWAEAIEKTEQLIAAKEKRKNGLMAKLLTGQHRINGFKASWRRVYLGELFRERAEVNWNDLPLLSITGENGVVLRSGLNRKDSSNDDKSKYLRICPGDIGYNTMRMWQGVSALSSHEGIISPAYTVCIPSPEIDGLFASYLFKLPEVVHLFYRHSQGLTSDTWNLKFHHFAEVRVYVPEVDEQIAIASILSALDKELAIRKKQRNALLQQKRGLMQKLLTGQWRVYSSKGVGST